MIKKESSLFKNAMNLGALAGIAISAIQLVFFTIGLNEDSGFQWLLYVILIFAISWGSRKFRDIHGEGYASYAQMLGFGTALAWGASGVFAFFNYVWLKFVDPEYLVRILEAMEIALYEQDLKEDEIEMAMSLYRKFFGPGMFSFSVMFNYTLLGFIASLVIAFFMRNPKPMFQE